jgi:hypothetical protein
VQDEDGDVWSCERAQGVYLVPHPERARIGEVSSKKVGRQVRRDKKVLETVDATKLRTTADQDAFNISAARLAFLGMVASKKFGNKVKRLVQRNEIREIPDKMSLNKGLDIMRGAYPNRSNPRKKDEDEERDGNPRPAPA